MHLGPGRGREVTREGRAAGPCGDPGFGGCRAVLHSSRPLHVPSGIDFPYANLNEFWRRLPTTSSFFPEEEMTRGWKVARKVGCIRSYIQRR